MKNERNEVRSRPHGALARRPRQSAASPRVTLECIPINKTAVRNLQAQRTKLTTQRCRGAMAGTLNKKRCYARKLSSKVARDPIATTFTSQVEHVETQRVVAPSANISGQLLMNSAQQTCGHKIASSKLKGQNSQLNDAGAHWLAR